MPFDVIILGLGAMGSAAAHHLAQRGKRVLAIEQFTSPHYLGSSHGRVPILSRLFARGWKTTPPKGLQTRRGRPRPLSQSFTPRTKPSPFLKPHLKSQPAPPPKLRRIRRKFPQNSPSNKNLLPLSPILQVIYPVTLH